MQPAPKLTCPEEFKTMAGLPSDAHVFFGNFKGPSAWTAPLRATRGVIVNRLRAMSERIYPIMAYDDGTPTKAAVLAHSYYPSNDAAHAADAAAAAGSDAASLNPDDISKTLDSIIGYVKSYPQDVEGLAEQEATYRRQLQVLEQFKGKLEDILKKDPKGGFPWRVEVPVFQNGQATTNLKTINDEAQLDALIRKTTNAIKNMNGAPTQKGSYKNRDVRQALYIKVLETYRKEILDEAGRHPETFDKNGEPVLPAAADATLRKIYSAIGSFKQTVPKQYLPTNYSFQFIANTQLKRELQEFLAKTLPNNPFSKKDGLQNTTAFQGLKNSSLHPDVYLPGDAFTGLDDSNIGGVPTSDAKNSMDKFNDEFQKVLSTFNSMTPEEKAEYHLDKLEASFPILRGSTIFGAATTTASLAMNYKSIGSWVNAAYQYLRTLPPWARNKCAYLDDDNQFNACVMNYLGARYPGLRLRSEVMNQISYIVIDPKDKTQFKLKPELQAEVAKVSALRTKRQQYKTQVTEQAQIVQNKLNEGNVLSDDFRKKTVALADKNEFTNRVLKIFDAKYPLFSSQVDDLIKKAAMANADAQATYVGQVTLISTDIGSELQSILQDHTAALSSIQNAGGISIINGGSNSGNSNGNGDSNSAPGSTTNPNPSASPDTSGGFPNPANDPNRPPPFHPNSLRLRMLPPR